jgi:hypothetical protein
MSPRTVVCSLPGSWRGRSQRSLRPAASPTPPTSLPRGRPGETSTFGELVGRCVRANI